VVKKVIANVLDISIHTLHIADCLGIYSTTNASPSPPASYGRRRYGFSFCFASFFNALRETSGFLTKEWFTVIYEL